MHYKLANASAVDEALHKLIPACACIFGRQLYTQQHHVLPQDMNIADSNLPSSLRLGEHGRV